MRNNEQMDIKWILFLIGTILLVENSVQALDCQSECNPQLCIVPSTDCYAGLIKDQCNCCMVCGRREGERCFNQTLSKQLFKESQIYDDCGDNLECRLRTDMEDGDKPEAICVCLKSDPICGTDGITYANECQFTEARYKRRNSLAKETDGPCKTAPQIITPPEDITNNIGSSVTFSCEVKGWPIPMIEWRMVNKEKELALPSDNEHISVQSRGGPSSYEITSWLQLTNIPREYSGTYTCVATNSEGQSRASAYLTIGNFKKNFDKVEDENENLNEL
uniref:Blo t Gal d 1 allergen n=1 Tax=Blomia tropicalis TaxID=40697 RepID=A1KXI9_BLOTA|nr:Blo t Gal d 1 allergen [Blomia tropicalis]